MTAAALARAPLKGVRPALPAGHVRQLSRPELVPQVEVAERQHLLVEPVAHVEFPQRDAVAELLQRVEKKLPEGLARAAAPGGLVPQRPYDLQCRRASILSVPRAKDHNVRHPPPLR